MSRSPGVYTCKARKREFFFRRRANCAYIFLCAICRKNRGVSGLRRAWDSTIRARALVGPRRGPGDDERSCGSREKSRRSTVIVRGDRFPHRWRKAKINARIEWRRGCNLLPVAGSVPQRLRLLARVGGEAEVQPPAKFSPRPFCQGPAVKRPGAHFGRLRGMWHQKNPWRTGQAAHCCIRTLTMKSAASRWGRRRGSANRTAIMGRESEEEAKRLARLQGSSYARRSRAHNGVIENATQADGDENAVFFFRSERGEIKIGGGEKHRARNIVQRNSFALFPSVSGGLVFCKRNSAFRSEDFRRRAFQAEPYRKRSLAFRFWPTCFISTAWGWPR